MLPPTPDILSMWMLFFSLLCATASACQHSHLAKDVEVFVTNCMNNPRSFSAGVDEMRVLQLFVFFVPTMFSGILGSVGKNLTVWSFLDCMQTQLRNMCCCIVARSDVSRVLHVFSINLCGSFFSRTLVCKGGQQFVLSCTWEHEIRVFELELRCCVTFA